MITATENGDGSEKYDCPECSLKYTRASLKAHLISHTQELPHRCSHCGRHFRQEHQLQAHIRHLHASTKSMKTSNLPSSSSSSSSPSPSRSRPPPHVSKHSKIKEESWKGNKLVGEIVQTLGGTEWSHPPPTPELTKNPHRIPNGSLRTNTRVFDYFSCSGNAPRLWRIFETR